MCRKTSGFDSLQEHSGFLCKPFLPGKPKTERKCFRGGTAYAAVLETVPFRVVGSNPTESTSLCGGTVYTAVLKTVAFGLVGSNPTKGTMKKINLVPEFIVKKSHYETIDEKNVLVIDEMKIISFSMVPRRVHDRQESGEEGRES